MRTELLQVLIKSIDLKGLANGIVDEVVEVALKKVVADSTNPIDDVIMASLWPVLEIELKKLIEENLDLATILGVNEAE